MKLKFSYVVVLWAICWISYCYSELRSRQVLVVAGNFSINNQLVNIAEFDIQAGQWITDTSSLVDLYLYGASNGIILDIAVNQSNKVHNDLYVVGAFDSLSELSQIQYCSVGEWDGISFNKLGEGLCPRGLESSVTITFQTLALGNNGDIFVGGNFYTRVWDGTQSRFVDVKYVAQFNGARWLPLWGGSLNCTECEFPEVTALSWDPINEVLYIGGDFDSVDNEPVSSGLVAWSTKSGFHGFPCAADNAAKCNGLVGSEVGLRQSSLGSASGVTLSLALDSLAQTLFVAGDFQFVRGIACSGIAVWSRTKNTWTCLSQSSKSISLTTAMYYQRPFLYLGGWASYESDWSQPSLPYAIASLDLDEYLQQQDSVVSPLEKRVPRKLRTGNDIANISRSANLAAVSDAPVWKPIWQWLPNFLGTNGPILRITGTELNDDPKSTVLFIAGAFNNMPPVIMWSNTSTQASATTGLQNKIVSIQGLVTSIAVASIQNEYIPPSSPPHVHSQPNNWHLFISAGIVILCLVLVSAIWCTSPFIYTVLPSDERSGSEDGIDNMLISLGTFEGNNSVSVGGIDFKQCYEQAMKSRELPVLGNSLLMINPIEVGISRVIGEGSFGRVWSGHWRNNSVAIKEFVFAQTAVVSGSIEKHRLIMEIVGEAGIMSYMHHPKVLLLYGCCLTNQAIWIITELCTHGSLRMVLDNTAIHLSILQKISFCLDIADGMMYMHNRLPAIIHRDLKSHNIFITTGNGKFVAKIGDWGSAKALAISGTKSMTHGVGTACWLAPEIITSTKYSKESDVYAFGIMLWEIYTRQEVYANLSAAQIISKVAYENLRPDIPVDCPWTQLMKNCWSQLPEERPTFSKILSLLSDLYSSVKKKGVIRTDILSTGLTASFPSASHVKANIPDGNKMPVAASYGSVSGVNTTNPSSSSLFRSNYSVIEERQSNAESNAEKTTLSTSSSASSMSEVSRAEHLSRRLAFDENTSPTRARVNSDPVFRDVVRMRENEKLRIEAGCRPAPFDLVSNVDSSLMISMLPNRDSSSSVTRSPNETDTPKSEDTLQYSPVTPGSIYGRDHSHLSDASNAVNISPFDKMEHVIDRVSSDEGSTSAGLIDGDEGGYDTT